SASGPGTRDARYQSDARHTDSATAVPAIGRSRIPGAVSPPSPSSPLARSGPYYSWFDRGTEYSSRFILRIIVTVIESERFGGAGGAGCTDGDFFAASTSSRARSMAVLSRP